MTEQFNQIQQGLFSKFLTSISSTSITDVFSSSATCMSATSFWGESIERRQKDLHDLFDLAVEAFVEHSAFPPLPVENVRMIFKSRQVEPHTVLAKTESLFEDLSSKTFQGEKKVFQLKWGLNEDPF